MQFSDFANISLFYKALSLNLFEYSFSNSYIRFLILDDDDDDDELFLWYG